MGSALLGARQGAVEGAEEAPDEHATKPTPVPHPVEPGMGQMSRLGWAAGTGAILSLVLCLVLPLTVFLGYTETETYKKWFLVVTIVYFIAAITWAAEREKVKSKSEVG